jgi:hypothetical protein
VIAIGVSNLGRAKNAVLKKLPGDFGTKNGQDGFVLKKWKIAAMGGKERQMTGANTSADAATIMSQACICMARVRGRQSHHLE